VRVQTVASAPVYEGSADRYETGYVRGRRHRSTGKSVAIVAGSAGVGAAIGAIAGGGKGAAIGAGVGAGAGTAAQVFIKGKQVKIPSETKLDFTLEQSVEITLLPGQSRRSRNQTKAPTEDSQQ
jgi:hypothetical protein